ncbi:hypothetical protein [Solimonas soli]|uniref:hypothetical protein n=1 Tax=Solimonas soli TaxID=413479 RepID=UPI0004B70C46|nr:hypothetical protein [Solimonas soli]
MKIRSLLLLVMAGSPLLASAATPGAGNSQPFYRDGQPAVATPPPAPVDDHAARAADGLRSALGRAGGPRFVMLWNRQLSDALVTEYESVAHTSQTAQIGASSRSASIETESRFSNRAVREQESSALAEDDDWQVRGAFESWLLDCGMNLVDRTAVLRQAGITVDSRQPNAQKIETEAINQYADYILEVLSTPASGPADARFRIRITQVKSGRTIVGFSSTGLGAERSTSGYVATDNGFRHVSETQVTTVDDVGANVAIEVAQRLSRALAP